MKVVTSIFFSVLASLIPLFILSFFQGSIGFLSGMLIILYLYFPYIFTGLTAFFLTRSSSLKHYIMIFIISQVLAYLLNHQFDPDDRLFETFLRITIAIGVITSIIRSHQLAKMRKKVNKD